ncbi:MAG: protein translocase subunit SecD [Patescibacteria group bacterium]
MKYNPKLILFVVVVLAIFAGFFVYPKGFGEKFLPWKLGLDLVGGSYLVYEVDMSGVLSGDRNSVLNGLRDVMERRVNVFGVSEPRVTTAKKGDSYQLTVELAGIKNLEEAIQQIGRTALLDFRAVKQAEEKADFVKTELTGRYLQSSQVASDPTTGIPIILIKFNGEGAQIFEELTAANVGKPLAIFLDDNLISMPTVQEKISGGDAQISGQFSFQEARQLVSLFNAGALPAPVNLIGQQTIGASLGIDSLTKSIWAGLIGSAAIIAFMILYYRRLGLVSSLVLVIYIVLTLAVFKLFGITMSLSGIAGFILSIGMAVDANILIFARTKEELKKGLSMTASLEEGFKRAWTSIRDSNISTILTSVILYYLTSSFVRGFALALLIGVLLSMFSAITVSRAVLRVFIKN